MSKETHKIDTDKILLWLDREQVALARRIAGAQARPSVHAKAWSEASESLRVHCHSLSRVLAKHGFRRESQIITQVRLAAAAAPTIETQGRWYDLVRRSASAAETDIDYSLTYTIRGLPQLPASTLGGLNPGPRGTRPFGSPQALHQWVGAQDWSSLASNPVAPIGYATEIRKTAFLRILPEVTSLAGLIINLRTMEALVGEKSVYFCGVDPVALKVAHEQGFGTVTYPSGKVAGWAETPAPTALNASGR